MESFRGRAECHSASKPTDGAVGIDSASRLLGCRMMSVEEYYSVESI